MNEQDKARLIEQILPLPWQEKVVLMEKHGLTRADLWPEQTAEEERRAAKRAARKKRTPATTRARFQRLAKQGGRCALCKADIEPRKGSCLDKTGQVVCRQCNQYLGAWRKKRAAGITEGVTVAFDTA